MLGHYNYKPAHEINLDAFQSASGIYQGTKQTANSRSYGHSQSRGLTEDTGESVMGALGEVALHIFLKLPFEYNIDCWGCPDLVTSKGYEVDVKTTEGNALFIAEQHLAKYPYRIYTLVRKLSETKFYITGYISGQEVIRREYKAKPYKGRPPAYCIPAKDLKTQFFKNN